MAEPHQRYLAGYDLERLEDIVKAARTMWFDFEHFRFVACEAQGKIEDLKHRLLEMDKRRWTAEQEVARLRKQLKRLERKPKKRRRG